MRAISRCVSISGCSEPVASSSPGDVAGLRAEAVQRDLSEPRATRGDLGFELLTDGIGERADLGRSSPGSWPMPAEALSARLCGQGRALDFVELGRIVRLRDSRKRATAKLFAGRRTPGPRLSAPLPGPATSAMLANVAASRTAMSARILRSSSTPADFNPLISLA